MAWYILSLLNLVIAFVVVFIVHTSGFFALLPKTQVCACVFLLLLLFSFQFSTGFSSHSGKACSNGTHLWTKLPCGQTWRQLSHPKHTPLLRRLPTSTPAHPFVYVLSPSNPPPDALPGHTADPLVGQSTDSNNVEMKRVAFFWILFSLICGMYYQKQVD